MEYLRGDLLSPSGTVLAQGVEFGVEDTPADVDPPRFHGSVTVPKTVAAGLDPGDVIRIEAEDGMAVDASVDRTSVPPEDDDAVVFFSR